MDRLINNQDINALVDVVATMARMGFHTYAIEGNTTSIAINVTTNEGFSATVATLVADFNTCSLQLRTAIKTFNLVKSHFGTLYDETGFCPFDAREQDGKLVIMQDPGNGYVITAPTAQRIERMIANAVENATAPTMEHDESVV